MVIGGALLRADNCREIFDKGTNMESGDVIVSRERRATRGWTRFYRGFNDCWNQTGHNNFRIDVGSRIWDSHVNGNNKKKF